MSGIGTDGSEYWRTVFLVLAGVWILLSLIRGWTQGILRQLLVPLAILGALAAVVLLAPTVSGFLDQRTPLSPQISGVVVAGALWFLVYNLILLTGGIIFKRTRDHDFLVTRLFFGMGGASLAAIFALLQIWLVSIGIRLLGRIAEDQIAVQSSRGAKANGLVIGLARLKNSLELGTGKATLDAIDPVPQSVYQRIEQTSQLLVNPRAVERLLGSPQLRTVWENPRVRALETDPEILNAIKRGEFLSLLSNPKVLALWNDPSTRTLLSTNQIQAALDQAALDGGAGAASPR
jgi:hypothetical protein